MCNIKLKFSFSPTSQRLEKEAVKLNNEQEAKKRAEVEKLRENFESEMQSAIDREKAQHKMTMESALNGLKASHAKEKATFLAAEESRLNTELERLKADEALKFEDKKAVLRQKIEDEEKKSLTKLEDNLLAKKHENERVIEQDKQMFDVLREERSKLEKRNKEELIKLQVRFYLVLSSMDFGLIPLYSNTDQIDFLLVLFVNTQIISLGRAQCTSTAAFVTKQFGNSRAGKSSLLENDRHSSQVRE